MKSMINMNKRPSTEGVNGGRFDVNATFSISLGHSSRCEAEIMLRSYQLKRT